MEEPLENVILRFLDVNGPIANSHEWAAINNISDEAVSNALKRLEGFEMVKTKDISRTLNVLTDEGEEICKLGSYEARVFNAIPKEGISKADLEVGARRKKKQNSTTPKKETATASLLLFVRFPFCSLSLFSFSFSLMNFSLCFSFSFAGPLGRGVQNRILACDEEPLDQL
jgi:hypothetical protein